MLTEGKAEHLDRLSFYAADLESDAGWKEATNGCDYVLHVASPFPEKVPEREDELIVPAREGTLRALRAAREAGVKRVVLTSSFVSIGYGKPQNDAPFDETTWSDLDTPGVQPYVKSKTLAERSAWDFVEKEGNGLELAVVNPVVILGPVLTKNLATSLLVIQRMLSGQVPGCPKVHVGVVDVRDVADLHLRAMTNPKAKGERFLCTAGDFVSFMQIANVLRSRLGDRGKRAPKFEVPDFAVRLISRFDPAVKQLLPELGHRRNATNEKAKRLLDWAPRSSADAIVASAESLFAVGAV